MISTKKFSKENKILFENLCRYLKISQKQAINIIKQGKRKLPISQYFKNLEEFNESTVMKGWGMHKLRLLRNFEYNLNKDWQTLINKLNYKKGEKIVDYGCSISSFTNWTLSNMDSPNITLIDVAGESINFCKFYYKDKVKYSTVKPNKKLPLCDKYDIMLCLDVLEHLFNPLEVIKHFYTHLNYGGRLVETFIDNRNNENPSNLESAKKMRPAVFKFLNSKMDILSEENQRRIWIKKKQYGINKSQRENKKRSSFI